MADRLTSYRYKIRGAQIQRFFEILKCLCAALLHKIHFTAIVVGSGELRIEPQRCVVIGGS